MLSRQRRTSKRSRIVIGEKLVRKLEAEVDFIPVVRTAVLDMGVKTPERALHGVEGFLQWFSMIPISDRIEHYVMLRGDVDRIWHSMILNTVLYREICDRYLGRFINHYSNPGCPRANWVLETVAFLEAEFHAALHPEFLEWRNTALRESLGTQPDVLIKISDLSENRGTAVNDQLPAARRRGRTETKSQPRHF